MSKMKKELPISYQPSTAEVERCLSIWHNTPRYFEPVNSLVRLYNEFYPTNDSLEGVMVKCAALNDIYSTNIFDVYTMAKHICNLQIDERLKRADLTLINDIANIEIKEKHHYFYSFATKYCSHHKPESYAIYDNYVGKVLNCMQKRDGFSDFKAPELRTYTVFMKAINDFKEKYGLEKYTLKQLDHYLWLLGKENFDPNAKERK